MNTHITLYRKYRPAEFSDVRGQDHVIETLQGAIKQNNISHAYLFYGSRGIGKTSIARILAKEIGCNPEDIYEIDGASNRKIEDIRELREAVRTLPFSSPYKVYIIDEVHMLTKEAFNALLKTLEEPPAHVIFILATTELDKIPDTIVSRCQQFTFRRPNTALLRDIVIDTAKAEGYTLESQSADLIAILGDGSFRDTLGVLQKVLSSVSDKKVQHTDVETITGSPQTQSVIDLLQGHASGNNETVVRVLAEAGSQNIDMQLFLDLVMYRVRAILFMRFSPNMKKSMQDELGESEYAILEELSTVKGKSINSGMLARLLEASNQLRFAHQPNLVVELAFMDLMGQNHEQQVASSS